MSIRTGEAKLQQSLKTLLAQWSQVRQHWRDATAHDFEKQYIAPLESRSRVALSAMSQMSAAIDQAQRDCS